MEGYIFEKLQMRTYRIDFQFSGSLAKHLIQGIYGIWNYEFYPNAELLVNIHGTEERDKNSPIHALYSPLWPYIKLKIPIVQVIHDPHLHLNQVTLSEVLKQHLKRGGSKQYLKIV